MSGRPVWAALPAAFSNPAPNLKKILTYSNSHSRWFFFSLSALYAVSWQAAVAPSPPSLSFLLIPGDRSFKCHSTAAAARALLCNTQMLSLACALLWCGWRGYIVWAGWGWGWGWILWHNKNMAGLYTMFKLLSCGSVRDCKSAFKGWTGKIDRLKKTNIFFIFLFPHQSAPWCVISVWLWPSCCGWFNQLPFYLLSIHLNAMQFKKF